jgi:hypothetical protein
MTGQRAIRSECQDEDVHPVMLSAVGPVMMSATNPVMLSEAKHLQFRSETN